MGRGGIKSPKRSKVESALPVVARIESIDAWRAAAIVLMIAYHLCFDLNYFSVLHQDFNHDPFWLGARSLIVSMFLAIVGVSLVLSSRRETGLRHFSIRETRIGACALLVSAGSYAMFPSTFIFFGILHFIFVASLVGMTLLRGRLPGLGFAAIGALAISAGLEWSSPLFDMPWLQWVGFMTHKPSTEDYVPIFPWIGVVLLGVALGRFFLDRRTQTLLEYPAPGKAGPSGPLFKGVTWIGRHSLLIYMLHQPILLGTLYLLLRS